MKLDLKEQWESFRREFAGSEADMNQVIATTCEELVLGFMKSRDEIVGRIMREHADGHRRSYCAAFPSHITSKKKASTHSLVWKYAIYAKGKDKRSVNIKRARKASMRYLDATLDKHTPEPFRELVRSTEDRAAWIRRFNKALVSHRLTQRIINALGDPPPA